MCEIQGYQSLLFSPNFADVRNSKIYGERPAQLRRLCALALLCRFSKRPSSSRTCEQGVIGIGETRAPLSVHSMQAGDSAVWEHFNAYPTHAARVRRLELMPDDLTRSRWSHEPSSGEHQERIPNGLDTGEYLKEAHTDRKVIVYSETLLIRAIHNMSNLLDFTWDRWVPAINRGDEESDETRSVYTEDIWTVLRDYSRLRKLKVVDSSFFNSRSIFSSLVRILPLISTYTN